MIELHLTFKKCLPSGNNEIFVQSAACQIIILFGKRKTRLGLAYGLHNVGCPSPNKSVID